MDSRIAAPTFGALAGLRGTGCIMHNYEFKISSQLT
jgi:hypothetical protein